MVMGLAVISIQVWVKVRTIHGDLLIKFQLNFACLHLIDPGLDIECDFLKHQIIVSEARR